MATGNGTRMFTVDKFLGLNESGDGDTELDMGEASRMENFLVTDAFNLTLRPGVRRIDPNGERTPAPILASWAGHVGEQEYLVLCDFAEGADRIFLYGMEEGVRTLLYQQTGVLGLASAEDACVKIFPFGGKLWVMSRGNTAAFEDGSFQVQEPYIPLVITGAVPEGGGTTLENINLLSPLRRIEYSADGEATAYVLPPEAYSVTAVVIDNEVQDLESVGSYDSYHHTFTFTSTPVKGVCNVEFTYMTDAQAGEENRMRIIRCPLVEAYNGSTDTRLFVAGDGSNMCYYTGLTQYGEATAMYFPAGNEVAVDMSDSPITGLVRHYSKMLVFKPDGTYTISYEPVTLTDGSTIAGFYLRNANREIGNDAPGQVQTVNNYPRTITKDGIYEWRITSSYYKDERYAKRVSDRVSASLRGADLEKIVTCDDNYSKTYYVFLNDADGTVLVNRYDLGKADVWCVYRSTLFRDVRKAMIHEGGMVFVGEQEAFCLDDTKTMDAALAIGGEEQQIRAVWESGNMHFGADFKRKYSSILYVSVKPEFRSEIVVTAETDKRDDYMEKVVSNNVFQWSKVTFPSWTFNTNDRPTINRVRLKVKKFVYYKLIFRIDTPGCQGTILGFDQQIRFSSMAK